MDPNNNRSRPQRVISLWEVIIIIIISLCTISEVDREVLFIKNNIFISKGSRCCKGHLCDKRLRINALNEIYPFKII